MFLGKEKIKNVEKNGSDVKVTFSGKNKEGLTLDKTLFELAKRENPTNEDALDAVYGRLAKKIMIELADYGITCLEVQTIVSHIGNLIHNAREIKVGEKFGVKNSQFIKIKDLI